MKRLLWADAILLVSISSARLISHRDLHAIGQGNLIVRTNFSGVRLIGRLWAFTSRLCQLIGVRSRFEERSRTGERDRGGSPEEQRAARGGTGQPDTQLGPFLHFFFFNGLNVNTEGGHTGLSRGWRGGKLACSASRRNLWK